MIALTTLPLSFNEAWGERIMHDRKGSVRCTAHTCKDIMETLFIYLKKALGKCVFVGTKGGSGNGLALGITTMLSLCH